MDYQGFLNYVETIPSLIDRAIAVANYYHQGQIDKQGVPYILHVLRVGLEGETDEEKIIGFLHDVIADTACGFDDLFSWFGFEIADTVSLLTHGKNTPYKKYIERVANNPLAHRVKINDIQDNLSRLDTLPRETFERLYDKYSQALNILNGVL